MQPARTLTLVFYVTAASYAALLVLFGFRAASQAPQDANTTTAIMIPSVCAALVLLLALVGAWGAGLFRSPTAASAKPAPSSRASAISGHLLMVLPFLFALLFFMPYRARAAQLPNFPQANKEFQAAVAAGQQFPTRTERRAFFRERNSSDHDTTYLVSVLRNLMIVSCITGAGLIVLGLQVRKHSRSTSTAPQAPQ